jgi:hypothetical protein
MVRYISSSAAFAADAAPLPAPRPVDIQRPI